MNALKKNQQIEVNLSKHRELCDILIQKNNKWRRITKEIKIIDANSSNEHRSVICLRIVAKKAPPCPHSRMEWLYHISTNIPKYEKICKKSRFTFYNKNNIILLTVISVFVH